jgi:alpha-L-arabinofuranosidase
MRRLLPATLVLALASLTITGPRAAAPSVTTLDVALDKPGAPIAETMYGVFYEDINFAADGGLYPERVKNRSFEFPDPLMGWKKAVADGGRVEVRSEGGITARNRHYLRVETTGAQPFGVMNDGFRGISVAAGEPYTFSVFARQSGAAPVALQVVLRDTAGRVLEQARVDGIGPAWARHAVTIAPARTHNNARLAVLVEGRGAADIDVVSLFPQRTFKNRPNGLRADLAQLLADMRPGFLRFPGGCIVEGRYLDGRYQWKETIGDPAERLPIVNRWNDEFVHRPAPDYYQSFGLGFYEYFQLAEDVGAEPMPILNCGMACQYNSGELAAMDQLDEYIQDALDLIEFANGPVTSRWGRIRADMGHPAPFNLKYMGIGNEQWGPEYTKRYEVFHRVLKEKHPEIVLIAAADPVIEGERFREQWQRLREIGTDIVDEHYYRPPAWFLQQVTRYDSYPRTGPRVFVGEFAAHVRPPGRGENRNTWHAALAEAAFMTGLERNADLVTMTAYAPLLAHVDAWQWSPNLIWFDNLRSYATPNYYVQQLFSVNRGTRVVPLTMAGQALTGQQDLFGSAALDEGSGEVILKVVNTAASPRALALRVPGVPDAAVQATTIQGDLLAENSLAEPTKVAPRDGHAAVRGGVVEYDAPPHSLTVLRVRR